MLADVGLDFKFMLVVVRIEREKKKGRSLWRRVCMFSQELREMNNWVFRLGNGVLPGSGSRRLLGLNILLGWK